MSLIHVGAEHFLGHTLNIYIKINKSLLDLSRPAEPVGGGIPQSLFLHFT